MVCKFVCICSWKCKVDSYFLYKTQAIPCFKERINRENKSKTFVFLANSLFICNIRISKFFILSILSSHLQALNGQRKDKYMFKFSRRIIFYYQLQIHIIFKRSLSTGTSPHLLWLSFYKYIRIDNYIRNMSSCSTKWALHIIHLLHIIHINAY